jgi:ribonuclease T2
MRTRPPLVAALAFAAIAASCILALAQREGGARDERRNVPGDFDYYTLVLSWSPTHCATPEGSDDAEQCRRQDGRRYGFVLHGLWPQYETGYPENCRTRRRPYVPDAVIDSLADIMPSRKLVIHEFRTHGTCSGLEAQDYFATARRLFEKVAIPDRFQNPLEAEFVAPEDLVGELVDSNPGLEAGMIVVSCGGAGRRLRDVRLCFSKDGEFRACGPNEDQDRLCRARSMYVPPVRSTRTGPLTPKEREQGERPAQPRPRLIQIPRGSQ